MPVRIITRRHRLGFDFIQFSSSIRHHYIHCGLYTLGYKNDYVCVYTDKSLNVYTWNMVYWAHDISKLTEECSNEEDVDKKIEILYKINSMLPKSYQLTIPSLVTDDFVNSALWRICQSRENFQIVIQ